MPDRHGGFAAQLLSATAFLATLALLIPAPAHAARGVEALNARMQAAQATLESARADVDRDAALAQMEAVLVECGKQRGCELRTFLETYRKAVSGAMPMDEDDGDALADDEDLIDIAGDDVPGDAAADALLDERNKRFVQMVQFNPAVQAGIRKWLTDMRPSLMQSYENYEYMRHLMAPAFQRHGMPEALLFGILAKESNGKVHVGSRAGAVGPLQFMPATGRRFGLGADGSGFDTRYDPQASAEAAAAYLQERFGQLGNSTELALAGYNGGEGRALRAYQSSGGRSFWDASVYDQFPAETKDYVPMVIAAAWLYLHPRDYGLRWPRVPNRAALLRLQRPTTLNELTICMGNPRGTDGYLRALRNLNPRFTPDSPLPAGGTINATTSMVRAYDRYCVAGKRADLARQVMLSQPGTAIVRVGPFVPVESAGATPGGIPTTVATGKPAPAKPKLRTHRVARGDNLVSISKKYQCDTKVLAQANGIKAPRYSIQPGQRLRLEGCRG